MNLGVFECGSRGCGRLPGGLQSAALSTSRRATRTVFSAALSTSRRATRTVFSAALSTSRRATRTVFSAALSTSRRATRTVFWVGLSPEWTTVCCRVFLQDGLLSGPGRSSEWAPVGWIVVPPGLPKDLKTRGTERLVVAGFGRPRHSAVWV
ncbi:unnamed protein product [Arctogadus glacialis]